MKQRKTRRENFVPFVQVKRLKQKTKQYIFIMLMKHADVVLPPTHSS